MVGEKGWGNKSDETGERNDFVLTTNFFKLLKRGKAVYFYLS
jgi:hypothetical protein